MTRVQSAVGTTLLLVLLAPAMASGQALSEEWGIDLPGNDYSSFGARSAVECKQACRADARCAAYTFNNRSQTCYLKDRVGTRRGKSSAVSGIKQDAEDYLRLLSEEWGYDRPGNDYSSFASAGAPECQQACRRDPRCEGYSFNTRSRTCYLKDSAGPTARRSDTVSGVKQDAETRFRVLGEEAGYDRPGSDYSSFGAQELNDCQRACRVDLRCEAYTYNTRSRTCYLKDRAGSKQRRPDTVSGIKQEAGPFLRELTEEWGFDYPGSDYASFPVGRLGDCARACQNDQACQAYSFNTRSQTCYLKNHVGSRQRRTDTVAGVAQEPDAPQGTLTEEPGYDHPGNDYLSFPARSASECRRACQVEARCAAYTFNTRVQICYLKNRAGPRQTRADTITGTKQDGAAFQEEVTEEWGYDYPGNDYSSFRVGQLAECVRACRGDRRCRAFSLDTRSLTCYLKNEIGNRERNADTVAGIKRGP